MQDTNELIEILRTAFKEKKPDVYGKAALDFINESKAKPVKETFAAYYYYAVALAVKSDFLDTIRIVSEAERLLLNYKGEFPSIMRNLYQLKSNSYLQTGDYKRSQEYMNKALVLIDPVKNKRDYSSLLNNLGMLNKRQGKFADALETLQKSLRIREELGEKETISTTYSNIAVIYLALDKLNDAEEYLQKSIDIKREIGDKRGLSIALNNIGNIYNRRKDYSTAINFYNESLELKQEINEVKGIAVISNNIGAIYNATGNYELAREYLYKSLELREKLGDMYGKTVTSLNIGDSYLMEGMLERANEYFQIVVNLSREIGAKDQLINCYKSLSDLEAERKNFEKALEYSHMMVNVKDEIFNETLSERIAQSRSEFELDQKERENELVRNKNRELEKLNHTLEVLNIELNEAIDLKSRIMSIIAHDLRIPLHNINLVADFIELTRDSISRDELLEKFGKVKSASSRVTELLNNLLEWARSQTGKLTFSPEPVSIYKLVQESFSFIKTSSEKKRVDFVFNGPDYEIKVDANMMKTVFRNLMSNALKFSHPESEVHVRWEAKDDFLVIKIADSGLGIPEDKLHFLFDTSKPYTTSGTNLEKGSGLGLILVKDFIDIHNGEITVESKVDKGTTFSLKLMF